MPFARATQASQPATSSVPAHFRPLSGLHRAAPCSSVQQSCSWMNDLLFLFTFLVSLFSPTRSCSQVWRTAEPCGSPAAVIDPALRLSVIWTFLSQRWPPSLVLVSRVKLSCLGRRSLTSRVMKYINSWGTYRSPRSREFVRSTVCLCLPISNMSTMFPASLG